MTLVFISGIGEGKPVPLFCARMEKLMPLFLPGEKERMRKKEDKR